MARVDIPLVGGPLDGRELDVEVDDDGRPPEQVPEPWLWLAYGSELFDQDLAGRYELEPVARLRAAVAVRVDRAPPYPDM